MFIVRGETEAPHSVRSAMFQSLYAKPSLELFGHRTPDGVRTLSSSLGYKHDTPSETKRAT